MAVITRRSANPSFGIANTSIDNDVITIPVVMEEKSNDSSSFFFRPEIILTIPLASKPNPRKMMSHFVANWGEKETRANVNNNTYAHTYVEHTR